MGNLSKATKGVWTIGEIYLEEPLNISAAYIANFLHDGLIDTAFSFPMQKALRLSIRVSHTQHINPDLFGLAAAVSCVCRSHFPSVTQHA